jgi:hypothetical protein
VTLTVHTADEIRRAVHFTDLIEPMRAAFGDYSAGRARQTMSTLWPARGPGPGAGPGGRWRDLTSPAGLTSLGLPGLPGLLERAMGTKRAGGPPRESRRPGAAKARAARAATCPSTGPPSIRSRRAPTGSASPCIRRAATGATRPSPPSGDHHRLRHASRPCLPAGPARPDPTAGPRTLTRPQDRSPVRSLVADLGLEMAHGGVGPVPAVKSATTRCSVTPEFCPGGSAPGS